MTQEQKETTAKLERITAYLGDRAAAEYHNFGRWCAIKEAQLITSIMAYAIEYPNHKPRSEPFLKYWPHRDTPTYDQLEQAYRDKRATMPVDHINHREFVFSGIRYFCGWDSRTNPAWFVYKQEVEGTTNA